MRIQIIITAFRLNGYRMRGLDVVLESVAKSGVSAVVIEQTNDANSAVRKMVASYAVPKSPTEEPSLKYIQYECADEKLIHKCAMMNHAARVTNAEYVWIVDADTLLDWKSTVDVIESTRAQAYNPAEYFVMMTDEQTEAMARERRQRISVDTHKIIVHPFSPCSLIIRADAFWSIGGFDERFIGYGWEDVDFILRLLGSGIKYMQLGGTGIHLWHPRENCVKGAYEIMLSNNPGIFDGLTQQEAVDGVRWVGVIKRLTKEALIPRTGPNAMSMAESLLQATVNFVAGGLHTVDDATYERRMSECQKCAWWTSPTASNLMQGRCGKCGCNGIKLYVITDKCPLGKW